MRTMRLVRNVIRPSNVAVYRQVRAHLDIKIPDARSFTASAPSNAVEAKKSRRRVTKAERRSMVEKYVNDYKAINAGKFPTTSDAVKDVGGSYYVVRQILQEIIYNFKMSSSDAGVKTSDVDAESSIFTHQTAENVEKEVEKEKQTAKAKTVINNLVKEGQISNADTESSSFNVLEPKEEPRASVYVESLKDDVRQSNQGNDESEGVRGRLFWPSEEPQGSLHSDAESSIKQETRSEDTIKVDDHSDAETSIKQEAGSEDTMKADGHYDAGTSIKQEAGSEDMMIIDRHSNAETSIAQATRSEDALKVNGLNSKAEAQQSYESEVSEREVHKRPAQVAESQRKTTLWQNLKSFAGNLFGVWKR